LKRPHGLFNPHGFDLELWLFEQGLRASGTVQLQAAGPQAELLGERVAHPVERARQAVRDAIVARVSDARTAGVLAALAVGDQAAIERDDWDLFRNTGVAHLMSISGLHVTMFAWLAGVLIAWAWRRSPRLMLRWPTPFAARWGGLAVAALYALFAGWGVPAQRTVLMLAAAAAARSLGLNWPWLLVLLMAAVVVTAFDPWALLQPGFWLSFAAVGLLMASEPVFRTPPSGWRAHIVGHLRTQVVATLGLAPLAIVFFQQVSIVGFFANLVAIPLVTLVITPLALAGALVPALWSAGAAVVQALSAILVHLSAWPGAVYTTAAASGWAVACGLLAGVVGLLPWPWRWRVLALPLAAPLLLPTVTRPAPGHFELLAADIGQGNAALVRTRNHLLVYDAGPQFSIDSDAGQRVLLPLLRARGEAQVDWLILSHSDWDHVGGAASLMAGLQVRAWSSSMPDAHPLRTSAVPHQRCEDGQSWTWDGVRFEVLHPTAADYGLDRKPNALSCVLRVEDSAGRGALLTGDIEAAQEAALVARHGAKLRSTLLMVPHHGSRTSSSLVFLDAVDPQSAFAQAGYRSRFGHPAADVVERYRALGIDLVRSDRCGAWTWHDGASECARTTGLRYWHWRDESNQ
jgi:competence protein ComEC